MKLGTQASFDQTAFQSVLLKSVKEAPADFTVTSTTTMVSLETVENLWHTALKLERNKEIPRVRAKRKNSTAKYVNAITETIEPKTQKKAIKVTKKGKPGRKKKSVEDDDGLGI